MEKRKEVRRECRRRTVEEGPSGERSEKEERRNVVSEECVAWKENEEGRRGTEWGRRSSGGKKGVKKEVGCFEVRVRESFLAQ